MVLKSFQARLEEAVEEEKKKEITAREKLDGLRFQVISTIQDRLSKPIQELGGVSSILTKWMELN